MFPSARTTAMYTTTNTIIPNLDIRYSFSGLNLCDKREPKKQNCVLIFQDLKDEMGLLRTRPFPLWLPLLTESSSVVQAIFHLQFEIEKLIQTTVGLPANLDSQGLRV